MTDLCRRLLTAYVLKGDDLGRFDFFDRLCLAISAFYKRLAHFDSAVFGTQKYAVQPDRLGLSVLQALNVDLITLLDFILFSARLYNCKHEG